MISMGAQERSAVQGVSRDSHSICLVGTSSNGNQVVCSKHAAQDDYSRMIFDYEQYKPQTAG